MKLDSFLATCLSVSLICFTAACDDDPSTDAGSDVAADTVEDTVDDTADDVVEDAGSDISDDTFDALEDADMPLPDRTCGQITAQDEQVAYDFVSPLAAFVGEAQTTKSGLDVSVVIPDPEDPENPVTFDGAFVSDSNCVPADYESLTVELCFYNPDGSAAAPEALGAFLYGFIAGTNPVPSPGLLGGVRRGVDLSCTVAGYFELDYGDVTATGDLPSDAVEAISAFYLDYLAIFETGNGGATYAIGNAPIVEPIDEVNFVSGDFLVTLGTGLEVDVNGTPMEYDVDIELDGTVDMATGGLTGNVLLEVVGGTPEAEGSISGPITGARN